MTEITLFAMKTLPNGDTTVCEAREEAEFYDVLVQDADGEVIDEQEDIPTYAEAGKAVTLFQLKYPGAGVSEI